MSFKVEAFQNRHLAPGTTRVDAIVSVTADANLKATGELVVGFILDKSGSMTGARIESVAAAVARAIALLDERALFFVVAFDGGAYVVSREERATPEAKRYAAQVISQLKAQGGTAMSAGLRAARTLFERAPNAIRRAVFLTDGKNEGEKPQAVAEELARCAGVFECDCWGVGTDWQVGEVQQIAAGLLGKASLIPEPAGVDAAFRAAIERARGKALKDVRLRLWTPQGARVHFVKQVSPTIDALTARAKVVSPQVLEYLTGSWAGGEARDFHVAIEVRPGLVGDELLAARPSLVYLESAPDAPAGWIEREEKPAAGRVFASWTDDPTLSARRDHHVVHYAGQDELAEAIHQGLLRRAQGDEPGATQLFGRAVRLAHASSNAGMTQRLARVVEVIDPGLGTVRLKRDVKKAATMELELESRTTSRLARRPEGTS
jgi:von Willebrand factor type A C-terminal domain/von Willebrand factor type A domain